MHELAHEFTSRKVSPWGGIKLFKQAYQQSGMKEFFTNHGHLPFPMSNRGYDCRDLIEQFMTATVLGANRLAHQEYLRADEVVREIFGWQKGMAGPSTLSRFFRKFDESRNARVLPSMFQNFWANIPLKKMTIDIDSTVIQRHGKAKRTEGAEVGYNPQRPGHLSHHPIIAFSDDMNMIVNAWMRAGSSGDATQATDFLAETIAIAGGRDRCGLIRADAGFYGNKIMQLCEGNKGELGANSAQQLYSNPYLSGISEVLAPEAKPIDYIIRARITNTLAHAAAALDDVHWNSAEVKVAHNGLMKSEYSEIKYKASGWSQERRVILVRRLKKEGQAGLQPKLFSEDERLDKYTLMAFVTSLDLSCKEVHKLYNGRANCENRIKELKYDYGVNGYALEKQSSTEAAFAFTMLTYNIMGLLKQYVLKKSQQLSTIRFQCIAIGSYLVQSGRKKKMKLAAEGKRRHFLEHVFDNVDNIGKELRAS